MRYTEHDEDRMIRVRASVIDDGERRIKELEAELAKWRKYHEELTAVYESLEREYLKETFHLRSCLKRLEWLPDEKWATETCYACGFSRPTHNAGCWLKLELEGK